MLREIMVNLSLLGVGILLGGALYDAIVLAPNLRAVLLASSMAGYSWLDRRQRICFESLRPPRNC